LLTITTTTTAAAAAATTRPENAIKNRWYSARRAQERSVVSAPRWDLRYVVVIIVIVAAVVVVVVVVVVDDDVVVVVVVVVVMPWLAQRITITLPSYSPPPPPPPTTTTTTTTGMRSVSSPISVKAFVKVIVSRISLVPL